MVPFAVLAGPGLFLIRSGLGAIRHPRTARAFPGEPSVEDIEQAYGRGSLSEGDVRLQGWVWVAFGLLLLTSDILMAAAGAF